MAGQQNFDLGFVRRAPYGVAALLFLLLVGISEAGRRAFASHAGSAPRWDWVILGYTLLAVILFLWIPRTRKRLRETKPDSAALSVFDAISYLVAMAPSLLAYCTLVMGADPWATTAALGLSGVLLALAARRTAIANNA